MKQQVDMVWDQGPCVACELGFLYANLKPAEKFSSVIIIFEYRRTVYSSDDNMMKRTMIIYS